MVETDNKRNWRTIDGNPPPAIPVCGFENEYCLMQQSTSNITKHGRAICRMSMSRLAKSDLSFDQCRVLLNPSSHYVHVEPPPTYVSGELRLKLTMDVAWAETRH